ncbi:hypothetical protein JGH11_19915 [Dysgonomonas sp. Marseille-P4677]|uniref:nuclear transport factor 2 family protein n=1 Tax=Dysgonomonas sp. Marseille-P4677 TaxID=2364790 RepID=UPI0019144925|nr:hypothetical protein [Dysgonomonas sp. Marseille-P4677]MBK5723137.1 hypothetical protein [Dysgonomonas sp. Marseille-P4677]
MSFANRSIVQLFNSCINNADIESLADLMTEDHIFIDMENNRIEGKYNCITQAWKPFFKLFSNYQNIFEEIIFKKDSTVIIKGFSISSDERLNNLRAIWFVEIKEEKVSLWRVYPDTKEIRNMLNL